MLYDLESHAKDGRCGLSRNEDIRRYVGKLVEKQTLDSRLAAFRIFESYDVRTFRPKLIHPPFDLHFIIRIPLIIPLIV